MDLLSTLGLSRDFSKSEFVRRLSGESADVVNDLRSALFLKL